MLVSKPIFTLYEFHFLKTNFPQIFVTRISAFILFRKFHDQLFGVLKAGLMSLVSVPIYKIIRMEFSQNQTTEPIEIITEQFLVPYGSSKKGMKQ